MKTRQLWFTGPGAVELRESELPSLEAGEMLVHSRYSAISAGTEMLVYRGQVPGSMALDDSLDALKDRPATYPLQYGYATVGNVEKVGPGIDESWLGTLIFAFQPHASHFITTPERAITVPEGVDPLPAVFLANMETAVTLLLDGAPRLGERVVVLGQGIVGLLVSGLLARFPLAGLYAFERIESRRTRAEQAGVDQALDPENEAQLHALQKSLREDRSVTGADLVFELSGEPRALNLALGLCGFSGRIIAGSWYGTKSADLRLGENFHRNRIQLVSSQVSTIAPHLTGRWDKARRFETSWDMIDKIRPEGLVTHRFPFGSAPEAYRLLDQSPENALQVVFVHRDENP